jgi:voltage-gated potassium channel Kch
MKTATSSPSAEAILVCGLGSLGQSCVLALKQFGVTVYAIDLYEIQYWEIPELPKLLDGFWKGDCRQDQVLEQAKIQECRAILLVTSNDRVNLSTAFAARSLNPNIRLIVRSQQENLNGLLSSHLGNFIAFEPTQLTASAIALAGLRDETLGFFYISDQLFRVYQESILSDHSWHNHRQLLKLNTTSRRVINHGRANNSFSSQFYEWEPFAPIEVGDCITYLEITNKLESFEAESISLTSHTRRHRSLYFLAQHLNQKIKRKWRFLSQTERVAITGILMMAVLVGIATSLYRLQYPEISIQDALNVALVLTLGGYDNLFGQLKLPFPIPGWLHLFSFFLTLFGTLFIGIVYAILTERAFSARLPFNKARPSIPKENHVVVIGLERVGQQVASLLQTLKQPCVGVTDEPIEGEFMPHLPLVVESIQEALPKINLENARSTMILTKDEMTNLEIGLMVQTIHPLCPIILRTTDSQFGAHIARLLPNAKAFSIDSLAAEVFAAAAFGEKILSLLHLNDQTLLVTEYQVEVGDTLQALLIAEVAYGFNVMPILHQRTFLKPEKFFPSEDIQLQTGDRLIVLATLISLLNIERGKMAPRTSYIHVEKALSKILVFEGIATMARVSGCKLGMAKSIMESLPRTLPIPLYRQQAQRLVYELKKLQILAQEIPIEN